MSYQQIIAPDLNTVGDVGWCLAFVEKAFNDTNYSYATATDGWDSCRIIHEDRNLPTDVSVPIWFTYYENGLNFGHVAINVPGRGVLSSPYKADNTQQWFSSIDQCANVMRCGYLGWSEDLMGVILVKQGGDDMVPDQKHLQILFQQFRQSNPTDDEVNAYVGKKSYTELIDILITRPEYTQTVKAMQTGNVALRDNWQGQIETLTKQLATDASPLAPGKYIVR